MTLKIAVVEDHSDLREMLVNYLSARSYDTAGFSCAEDLDDHLSEGSVDVLILDLNLPGEDGYSIARRMRDSHPTLNIVMLTARTSLQDRVKGYVSGADVYLSKPIEPEELGAVIASMARRVESTRDKNSALAFDVIRLVLFYNDREISLSKTEGVILKGLAEAPGNKLAYWRILEIAGLEFNDAGKSALGVRVSRLKKKLADAGIGSTTIKALWKDGYQLCIPIRIM